MNKNFTKKNDRFITKDSEGNENGSLITIYNNTENPILMVIIQVKFI